MDEHTSGAMLGLLAIILASVAVLVGAYGAEIIGSLQRP
jgi:hypothetical protein